MFVCILLAVESYLGYWENRISDLFGKPKRINTMHSSKIPFNYHVHLVSSLMVRKSYIPKVGQHTGSSSSVFCLGQRIPDASEEGRKLP